MADLTFPYSDYDDAKSALLCVPIGAIPLYRRFYELMQRRSSWADRESWWRGYQLAAEAEENLMSGCLDKLIESNERIYRLLDRSFNGTAYVATPDPIDPILNPPVITPAIAAVPAATSIAPGLLARFERLLKIEDNLTTGRTFGFDAQNPGETILDENNGVRHTIELMQGILKPGWLGIGGEKATLVNVIEALRIGDTDETDSLWETVQDILAAGSNITSIAGFIKSLLDAKAAGIKDGALFGVLIVSSIANASLLSLLTQQNIALRDELTAIVEALRGDTPPDDNLLQALRGDDEASATRNVIDRLATIAASPELLAKLDLVLAALRGPTPPDDNILQALRGDEDASATRNVITVVS